METIVTVGISIVVSLTVSIVVKIAIGVKWIINVNEINNSRKIRMDFERKSLENWWNKEQFNFSIKNGKLFSIIDGKDKKIKWATKKYKRLVKLQKEYNQGKLLVIQYQN
ncbi:MAG: hypothetical protein FWF55_05745 [Treponema sp.]|nr:hypothetical protein [Treponema sp.]